MDPTHIRKLMSWAAFNVVLPLAVYPVALLLAVFAGLPFTFHDVFVRGDVLFLTVVLLATSLDWTATDLLFTPQNQAARHYGNYLWFIVTLLLLLGYTAIYGWLI